jgi:transcriptional regulator with XRE-family HTH domain
MASSVTLGDHLRNWRRQRRLSQLDLALEANISPRHLSFVETGRAQPSREMILHLCEQLRIPLRERNLLLLSAGFAPTFPERRLDDPALGAAREAIELVLGGHEPYPALAIDRHWHLVSANQAATRLLQDVDPALLAPLVNALRISLPSARAGTTHPQSRRVAKPSPDAAAAPDRPLRRSGADRAARRAESLSGACASEA